MAERCDLIMMRKPCHSIFTGHPLQLSKLFNNRVSSFSPLHSFMKPPAPTSSSSSCSVSRVMAMVFALNKEDNILGIQWQPLLRFDRDELIAEAPFLNRNCEDLDWEKQALDLRALANLSLQNTNKTIDAGSNDNGNGDTWFSAGLALATALIFQFGTSSVAFGAEEMVRQVEAAEAASRAPAWLAPSLLAFPLVSYAIFSVYRTQVNPYANVSDWLFGVAAVVIIANLVLISTIGVRLY